MIGDRMDTDIVAGLEAGLETVLVLTGISTAPTPSGSPTAPRASSTRSRISRSTSASAASADGENPPRDADTGSGVPGR